MSVSLSNPRGLLDVRRFIIPKDVLSFTLGELARIGRDGAEAFAVWGGIRESQDIFRFTNALIPEQKAFSTREGLLVVVGGDALFHINKTLYERGEILGGQVHTHPTTAYHSETDDHFPLVTLVGALSLVIPNFARYAPGDIEEWAWYRLLEYGRWASVGAETEVVFE